MQARPTWLKIKKYCEKRARRPPLGRRGISSINVVMDDVSYRKSASVQMKLAIARRSEKHCFWKAWARSRKNRAAPKGIAALEPFFQRSGISGSRKRKRWSKNKKTRRARFRYQSERKKGSSRGRRALPRSSFFLRADENASSPISFCFAQPAGSRRRAAGDGRRRRSGVGGKVRSR